MLPKLQAGQVKAEQDSLVSAYSFIRNNGSCQRMDMFPVPFSSQKKKKRSFMGEVRCKIEQARPVAAPVSQFHPLDILVCISVLASQ